MGGIGEIMEDKMKAMVTMVALVAMMVATSSEAEAAKCKVELVNGNGRVLEVFKGHGYDRQEACQEARRECRQVKRAGYYRARVQKCEVVQQRNRMVQRSCSAEMTGPRGHRVFDYVTAYAEGIRGTGVKMDACRKALRKCLKRARMAGRMRALCTADNGISAQATPYGPSVPRRGRY